MRALAGDAVRLEPQVAAHAPALFELLLDPALYEHENEPPPSLEWLRDRLHRLESRASPDGREQWLNWVVRLPSGEAAGYVQATVYPGGRAAVAYVLNSRYWHRGLATAAVRLMMDELAAHYGVARFGAVLKRTNVRSLRLLERLGFVPASGAEGIGVDPGEMLMKKGEW